MVFVVVYDANVLYGNAVRDMMIRLRQLIIDAVPDCLVEGYQPLMDGLKLPDKDDRHVLAAAIKANAQVIVTSDLDDFPPELLAPWDIEAKSPDDFLLDQIALDGRIVWACVQQIADSRNNPPENAEDVLDALERAGLIEAVAALRDSRSGC